MTLALDRWPSRRGVNPALEKPCRDCGEMFPRSEFDRTKTGQHKGELHPYCRKCDNRRCAVWRASNPEKANTPEHKAYRQEWRRKRRVQVLQMLGGACVRCGFADDRALQVDHVNGGDSAERQSLGGNEQLLSKILRAGGVGYQLLCANCNWIKRVENQEHIAPKLYVVDGGRK